MQHLRVIGEQSDAILLEAPHSKAKAKGKSKEVSFGEKVYTYFCFCVDESLDFPKGYCLLRKRVNIELKQCRIFLIV
jgi:hypothetical protein